MKMKIGLALVITFFLGAPVFADPFATGDVLPVTGFNNADASVFWAGSFTLGASAGGSLWNLSAFAVDPLACSTCTPSLPPWTFPSLQFDGATGDLLGMAQANFSGLGLGVHLLTLTFVDGNNTSDTWTDVHFTTKTGTFSYCVGANCTNPNVPPASTPEPSAYLLLASGLMSLVVIRRLNSPNR